MTVAYWCVFVAAILPYVYVGIAKAGRDYDNRAPRAYLEGREGARQRAHWAHLNSFEAFPPFAAAVIIAHLAGAAQGTIDGLAVAFVVARVVYGVCFIAGWATARSLVWTVGMACVLGLFFAA